MSDSDVDGLVKDWVIDRYTKGAEERQAALCCPSTYREADLSFLPQEIVERDYGCGDPLRYLQEGDAVLDLGSGSGKACYLAAKKVGPSGSVIGIDMNDSMLALARKYQDEMAEYLGGHRVDFRKGHIEDLRTNLDILDDYLRSNPVSGVSALEALQRFQSRQGEEHPLVASSSIDVVVSNCVLNLVGESARRDMVQEIFRVLRPGGRVAISDIVVDRPVPETMKRDPELWSGCLSGAFQEQAFLEIFAESGFEAVCYEQWFEQPWQVIDGYEFRSVTLTATKPYNKLCGETANSVVCYRGPYKSVTTDCGEHFERGVRVNVTPSRLAALVGLGDDPIGYRDSFVEIKSDREVGQTGRASCC